MPENTSFRHKLPYLVVAQAQKELTHNEALARIDALLHPVVQSRLAAPPILSLADTGKCWLIDAGGIGEWSGKVDQIAVWAGGSWRYVEPVQAMRVHNVATNSDIIWSGGQWIVAPTFIEPASGTVIDIEARTAIVALLSYFRAIGQFTA